MSAGWVLPNTTNKAKGVPYGYFSINGFTQHLRLLEEHMNTITIKDGRAYLESEFIVDSSRNIKGYRCMPIGAVHENMEYIKAQIKDSVEVKIIR